MKTIILLITLLLLCGTANALAAGGYQSYDPHASDRNNAQYANTPPPIDEDPHYIIAVIVWDNVTGHTEAGVPVTFGGLHTLHTAEDGSVVFDTANLDGVEDGSFVAVSCKYGVKNAPVIYGNWGAGITYNEPDEITAIEAFTAMGLAAIALGGGRYILRRKKNTIHKGDTMADETTTDETTDIGSKLVRDFGVRALIATTALLGYIAVSGIAVYRGDMSMLDDITQLFTPVISVVVMFYFGGSMIRDGLAK